MLEIKDLTISFSPFRSAGSAQSAGSARSNLAQKNQNFEDNFSEVPLQILRDFSCQIEAGKITALVGESGCGKSCLALAIVGLLKNAKITGKILFEGQDLLTQNSKNFPQIRGKKIGFIFQDSNSALNPLHKIGQQIAEAILIHHPKISRLELKSKIFQLLEEVGLQDFQNRLNDYPHQLSGGQKQRIMIAIAIANRPKIILADEPTTALHEDLQEEILQLLLQLKNRLGTAILLISHQQEAVSRYADKIVNLSKSEINNDLPEFKHDLNNKSLDRQSAKNVLRAVGLSIKRGAKQVLKNADFALKRGETLAITGSSGSGKSSLALALCGLIPSTGKIEFSFDCQEFSTQNWQSNRDFLRRKVQILFQDPFSSLNPRMTVAEIISEGLKPFQNLYLRLPSTQNFQTSDARFMSKYTCASVSENPSYSSHRSDIFKRFLKIYGLKKIKKAEKDSMKWQKFSFFTWFKNRSEQRRLRDESIKNQVLEITSALKLPANLLDSYPHQLSGGQRQRVALASILILRPEIIILDEPTSALDFATRNEILSLLFDLQKIHQLTYILISHDSKLVKSFSNKVLHLK